jgi:hydroxylamine reductase (hybrid-cluster protein)
MAIIEDLEHVFGACDSANLMPALRSGQIRNIFLRVDCNNRADAMISLRS